MAASWFIDAVLDTAALRRSVRLEQEAASANAGEAEHSMRQASNLCAEREAILVREAEDEGEVSLSCRRQANHRGTFEMVARRLQDEGKNLGNSASAVASCS